MPTYSYLNVLDYGADPSGSNDSTIAIQNAINEVNVTPISNRNPAYNNIIIPEGTYKIGTLTGSDPKFLTLLDNQTLIIKGTLDYHYSSQCILIDGKSNVKVIGMGGGELKKNVNNSYTSITGIKVQDSNNVEISGLKITNFVNKGIGIIENTSNVKNITVRNNTISGSNDSTSGAAISVHNVDDTNDTYNVSNCTVESNYISDSRIGITVNGCTGIIVTKNQILNSTLAGIMLDGVTTNSGDGSKYCIVSSNVIDGTTSSTYAGIYMGNGASNNVITGNMIKNSAGSGIKNSGVTDYHNKYNIINANFITGSADHGIYAALMNNSIISNNICEDNDDHGIFLHKSDYNTIDSNYLYGSGQNSQRGILLQSGNNWVHNNVVTGYNFTSTTDSEKGRGLKTEYTGTDPDYNVIENNDFSGNTIAVTLSGTNTVLNNRGYNPPEIIAIRPTGTETDMTLDTSASIWYGTTVNSVTITTYTLPPASGNKNIKYTIVNRTTSAITSTTSFYNLSGSSTTSIAANSSVTIISDGGSWRQIQ